MPDLAALTEGLTRLLRDAERANLRVAGLEVMADGHAGLTFGFRIVRDGQPDRDCVLKIAPQGVPRRGSTDIYRQAPLLRALKPQGLPVPQVLWAAADEETLGAPFIVMERLPGRSFVIWEPHASFPTEPAAVAELWRQAVRALARIHQVNWRSSLPDWEVPVSLREELQRWTGILRHAQEPAWLQAGTQLLERLGAQLPLEGPVGLVHGDFQPGNVLYHHGRLSGVIDWDLAAIGAQGIDVGWLMMMCDLNAWAEHWKPHAPLSREQVQALYAEAGGTALEGLDWFQAFAHYRMGAIACLNVKLHRNGRRPDLLWERFAPSISTLFARGLELLRAGSPA